jgi:hypothetical protein
MSAGKTGGARHEHLHRALNSLVALSVRGAPCDSRS